MIPANRFIQFNLKTKSKYVDFIFLIGNHPSDILEKMAGKELCSKTKRRSHTTSRMGETGGAQKTERKS